MKFSSPLPSREKRNDIAIVSNLGNIHVLDVPESVEQAIKEGRPCPSFWTYGMTIEEFIIAPRYKTRLVKLYGETSATKIYNRIELHLVGCKVETKSIPKESNHTGEFDL
jgi:hypothetical protein